MTAHKQTYKFAGSITCLEPLTVSIKEAAQGARGHRLPRNGPALDTEKPFFPASSIRGALRNAAHRVVLRAVKKQSGEEFPFSLDDHFMLAQGVDSGKQIDLDKTAGVTDLYASLRAENPMLSVFGRWGLESHLAVGHGLPSGHEQCWGMFGGGARGVMFERDANLLDELTAEDTDRLEQILLEQTAAAGDVSEIKKEIAALKKTLRGASKEEREAGNARIALLEDQIKMRKQDKSGPVESIRRPLDPFEAFSAGAVLSHRMALRSATEAELGMLILSLREFARDAQLGGHKAHNCGAISAEWTVTTWPEDADAPIEVGKVAITPDGFIMEGDMLQQAVSAFTASLPEFNFKRAV
jgi:CRISPR type IV-associated protein Csf2